MKAVTARSAAGCSNLPKLVPQPQDIYMRKPFLKVDFHPAGYSAAQWSLQGRSVSEAYSRPSGRMQLGSAQHPHHPHHPHYPRHPHHPHHQAFPSHTRLVSTSQRPPTTFVA